MLTHRARVVLVKRTEVVQERGTKRGAWGILSSHVRFVIVSREWVYDEVTLYSLTLSVHFSTVLSCRGERMGDVGIEGQNHGLGGLEGSDCFRPNGIPPKIRGLGNWEMYMVVHAVQSAHKYIYRTS